MRKLSFLFFVLVYVVIGLSFALPANAQKNGKFKRSKNAIPNRYIVVLNDDFNKIDEVFNNASRANDNALRAEAVNRVRKELTNSYGGTV